MPEFLQSLLMILEESAIDTLKAVPILFAVYILVSYFEHNSHKYVGFFKKAEKFGPVVGATLGIVPQCGFSVAMADLYNKKSITLGTLIAIFIATSDEAIPILLSNYDFILPMLLLISIKFIYAIICGYIIDLILLGIHKKRQNAIVFASPLAGEPCECGHEGHEHEHNHEHPHHCCADNIFIDALKHTLKITIFIFVVNLIMNLLIEFSGFNVSSLMNINKFAQPFITSLIGLIPNCVASVLMVEIYMAGGMTFGSMLAGLCTGAGVGLLILFKRNKKNLLSNLFILSLVYTLGVILGIIVNLFIII